MVMEKKNSRILVLEDDLETVENIFSVLRRIEDNKEVSFAAAVLTDYIQVDEFINKSPQIKFDILLLDRDCFLGGSFHDVNFNYFDKDKVISILKIKLGKTSENYSQFLDFTYPAFFASASVQNQSSPLYFSTTVNE